jgi:hypothetical protein
VAGASRSVRAIGRPVTHGATSERQIRPLAANHRRRVLRQLGLSASDLDPVARGYLTLYTKCSAKIDLCDQWIDEHGLLAESGEMQPLMKSYVSLVNSARLSLSRLEEHLRERGAADPLDALQAEGRLVRLEAERRLRGAS